jgi:hypothetical protein
MYARMYFTVDVVEESSPIGYHGTSSLVVPHISSHSRLAPSTWTVLTVRKED